MNNEPNISLYGDAAGEEFPVLKAFQQYIDAEQAKARKRLLTVSIFFGVVLISVIGIFSFLIVKANNRSQVLNDRLYEYAMKDSERKVQDARTAAAQEATVKSLNDTLERMQQRIAEQDRKATEAAAAAAKELAAAKEAAAKSQAAALSRQDPEIEKRNQENEAKLQKAIALLKAEKQKLAEEKEKLRQQELEHYRRQHYPQYYAKQEAVKAKRQASEDELEDLYEGVTYFDEPAEKAKPQATKPVKETKKHVDLESDEDAIEYFNDDEYTIPVEVKGKRAGWRVPLN